MIDFGFSGEQWLIDNYFAVMICVVFVLSMASALRYYLVTTLGERIVSDLREQVFGHLIALSPAFFDRGQTGEMMSRLTADTDADQGGGRRVGLGGAAQSRAVPRRRRDDGDHQSAAVDVRAGRYPGDRLAAGGFRTRGAKALASERRIRSPKPRPMPAETIGAVRTVQAFTSETYAAKRFGGAVEHGLSGGATVDVVARDPHRHRHLPCLRERRDRAVGRRQGRAGR